MPAGTRSEAVGGFAAAAYVVIVLLSVGVLPGFLATNASCPTWFYLGGPVYCGETVPISSCSHLLSHCEAITTSGVEFHGVLFRLNLSVLSGGKADLGGFVTEPNGTAFPVLLVVTPLTGGAVHVNTLLNWTSPDQSTSVYPQFFRPTVGGGIDGNVTLGVAAP